MKQLGILRGLSFCLSSAAAFLLLSLAGCQTNPPGSPGPVGISLPGFVTGGGWIESADQIPGDHANFGFNGEQCDLASAPTGHFNFHDMSAPRLRRRCQDQRDPGRCYLVWHGGIGAGRSCLSYTGMSVLRQSFRSSSTGSDAPRGVRSRCQLPVDQSETLWCRSSAGLHRRRWRGIQRHGGRRRGLRNFGSLYSLSEPRQGAGQYSGASLRLLIRVLAGQPHTGITVRSPDESN